ncbi:MAG TPA: heparinase II/III family protein [Bacteroidota bacterium]|nr:heparinase II/III family protein [Bacteroidota bacterium]
MASIVKHALPGFRPLLLPVLLLLCLCEAAAQYPVINAGRPRIVADAARLTALRQRIAQPGEARNTFLDINHAYRNWWINDPQLYVLGEDSTQWHWDWSSQWAGWQTVLSVTIATLTEDSLEWKRCRFIAEQAARRIDTADFSTMEWYAKEQLLRQMSDVGGLLLDWCYDRLPVELRQRLARAMFRLNDEFMRSYIYSSAGNSYVSSHNTWNTIYCNQNALVLHEADGLDAARCDTVRQWFRDIHDKFTTQFLPVWTYYRDDDGGWNWGAAYAMWSLVDQFQLFENLRVGTNRNYFSEIPWLRDCINQYIYFMQPNGRCIHLGDGETTIAGDRVMHLHARYFRDPRSQWLARYWSQPSRLRSTMDRWTTLLYKDFDLPEVERPANPLHWWADKVGLAVSFSSWEPDATMVTFFCSPSKRAAHEHRDNNSFTVFRGAPLLIDAGYYDSYASEHYRNYYQRSIAHNTICVFDSTERYGSFGSPASNDGGQVESDALMNFDDIFRPRNQRGRWLRHASGAGFSYSMADAQLSYDSTKVSLFRRRVLFLPPERVLVVDHIQLRNRATRQRDVFWLGHFASQPQHDGALLEATVPGHVETFAARDTRVAHGGATLALRTLLPEQLLCTRIGEAGYEYWVNGMNYPPSVTPDSSYTPGAWRIELRPAIASDTVVYVNSITVGDSGQAAVPEGKLLRGTATLGVDSRDTLLLFPAAGEERVSGYDVVAVPGSRLLTMIAFDLDSLRYELLLNGQVHGSARADSNGMLVLRATLPAGLVHVEIRPTLSALQHSHQTLPAPLEFSPQPVREQLTLDALCEEGSVEVYDMLGVRRLLGSGRKLSMRALPPGVYMIVHRSHHGIRTGRLLKL